MNFRTTLVLVVLAVAGAVVFWLTPWTGLLPGRATEGRGAGSLAVLETELTPDQMQRIDVQAGDQHVVLERGPGGVWSLPGGWPIRKAETEELVGLLGRLRSRFEPVPVAEPPDLAPFGLEHPAVTVAVRAGGGEHRLTFGEEPGDVSRFSRATYLRVDDKPEVLRLAPGLVSVLRRPQEYYQQRRLFEAERVAKTGGEPGEKVEQLDAKEVDAQGAAGAYALERMKGEWELRKPVRDRADPDQLRTVLTAVPEVWAERFMTGPRKALAEYGLDKPEQTLRVAPKSGRPVKLLVGKQSRVTARTVVRPAPNFGGPPMPPQKETVHDEYRYAKLEGNEQIFEVKADKLKDIFVAPDTLRDPRLARFRADDADRVEVHVGGADVVLVKEKDRWRVKKPFDADAESLKVTELLDKLSGLEARGKDVIDPDKAAGATPTRQDFGLRKPRATVTVRVREEKDGAPKDPKITKEKSYAFAFGSEDVADKKLYVRVAGWERVNRVDDAVWKLVDRPALAYRGRRVLDFSTDELAGIQVRRPGETFALQQAKQQWELAEPVSATADAGKAGTLAGDLGRLEAVEFVSEAPPAKDLEGAYGLAKAPLSATVTFAKKDKPARTLIVGKQRGDKGEYFAQVVEGASPTATGKAPVFVVKKDIRDTLERPSLAYRPLQLWDLRAEDVAEIRVEREGKEYRLRREGEAWKVTEPFAAPALATAVDPVVKEAATPRGERYEANAADDPAKYGLDKPYLRLTVLPAKKEAGKEQKQGKDEVKEHVLLVGKVTGSGAKTRYARLGSGGGVLVVGEALLAAADHRAVDFLNRDLLSVDPAKVTRVLVAGAPGKVTLRREGARWQAESPAAKFTPDEEAVNALVGTLANLRAERFEAYGPGVKLEAYHLDKPAVTVTFTTQPGDAAGKAAEHTLAVGDVGKRWARLDSGPGVFVLEPAAVAAADRGYLGYVERTLVSFDAARADLVQRKADGKELELARREDGWAVTKPAAYRADDPTVEDLVRQLSRLRAKEVAAYQAKDLAPFGLDAPAAVVTVQFRGGGDPRAGERVLKIGKVVPNARPGAGVAPDRYVMAEGGSAVGVLSGGLAARLLADVLQFRDRNVAQLGDMDRAVLEQGPRKAAFAKSDGVWRLVRPTEAEAEQTALEEFLTSVAHLRADELVAEKPANLKPYGLDQPAVVWRFFVGGKEALALLVGAAAPGKETGERRYAKLEKGDLVFLLDPRLTGLVLGEYRSRTVFSTLDAAQVEGLRYRTGGGGFGLEKVNNNWQVAGKPGLKVKVAAVTETLDALARLKVERFVVDHGADLKLYGLAPPEVTVEVQTPTGSRSLQIGRAEGGSKRRYARVPEEGRSDVFIIGEADARLILRDLTAFTEAAGR